jgi:hypothetical protein
MCNLLNLIFFLITKLIKVIKIMGRTLAPFAGNEQGGIPVFGFGDSSTGDWSVFPLNGTAEGECSDLEDVLRLPIKIKII